MENQSQVLVLFLLFYATLAQWNAEEFEISYAISVFLKGYSVDNFFISLDLAILFAPIVIVDLLLHINFLPQLKDNPHR
jgi:hypothetical protein